MTPISLLLRPSHPTGEIKIKPEEMMKSNRIKIFYRFLLLNNHIAACIFLLSILSKRDLINETLEINLIINVFYYCL